MLKSGNAAQELLRRLCMFCHDGAKFLAVTVDTALELLRRRCVFCHDGVKFRGMSFLLSFHVRKLDIDTFVRTAVGRNVARAATGSLRIQLKARGG